MNVIRKVFLFVSAIQLMIACCDEQTYEVTITDIDSNALVDNGSDFVAIENESPIDKEKLVIDIRLIEVEKIASNQLHREHFRRDRLAKAAIVPCEDQIVVFTNQLAVMKIELVDPNNGNERVDITNQLVIEGSQTSIADFIAGNSPGIGGFFIEFSNTMNIPDRIELFVEATLDDGAVITSSIGIINFN